MANKIVFDKELREKAKEQGTALFAFGMETSSGKSRLAAHTPTLTAEEADCLTAFLLNLTSNRKPLDWCVKVLKKDLNLISKRCGINF